MTPATGASLHETKDMYVDTPAPTHDASCNAEHLTLFHSLLVLFIGVISNLMLRPLINLYGNSFSSPQKHTLTYLNVVVEKKSSWFSEGITTVFTVFNSVEYEGTLRRLDALSVNYLFKVIDEKNG
jgi:hypothetical protein